MKGDFVIKFLETFRDMVVDVGNSWSKVPYKGFRYSSFKMTGYGSKEKYKGFKNLEQRGLIKNKNNSLGFTKSGQKWLQASFIRYFREKSGGRWDKKWRIVIFDIPQEMHNERTKLRRKLKSLGFAMLQKSVFIFPYPCEEEVGDVCETLGIVDYVDILTAHSAGFREEEFLKIFDL